MNRYTERERYQETTVPLAKSQSIPLALYHEDKEETKQPFNKQKREVKSKINKEGSNPPKAGAKRTSKLNNISTPGDETKYLKAIVAMDDTNKYPPRELWAKKFDFLMSIIGFSVDLASVWRL
jgi:hypothetical protein